MLGDTTALNSSTDPLATMIAAGSNHAGGVDVRFVDGSVGFNKGSINLGPWEAFGTVAGGEVVDSSSF
jgi:hypothetical protein